MEPNDIRFFIKTDENISTEVGDLIKNHHRLFVTVSDSDRSSSLVADMKTTAGASSNSSGWSLTEGSNGS